MTTYPLKVSSNGRYLVDQNNVPTLLVGDAAWSLESQCTNAQIDQYLADRASRGFNAVIFELIEHKFADNAPNNIDNVSPWNPTIWTTQNDTYFQRVDHIVSQAATYGICCVMFPLYTGATGTTEGWRTEIDAASTANMQAWADFVGNRYKNSPNIIWVIGGDYNLSAATTADSTARGFTSDFAAELALKDTNHLITAHSSRGRMALDDWSGAIWLTLNTTYTDQVNTPNSTSGGAAAAYASSGPVPFVQIEAVYENASDSNGAMTAQRLRSQWYWTILGGGSGHFFGNCPLWSFGTTANQLCNGNGTWQNNLGTSGAIGIQHGSQLVKARQWHNLVPDTSHSFVTAGYGTLGTSNFVSVAKTIDSTLAMAYLPSNTTLTVAMSQMASICHARWFDPTNGTYQNVTGQPFNNVGNQSMTPPATNNAGDADWVLLIETYDPGQPPGRGAA